MKYRLRIRAAARREIAESLAWYEERSEGVAQRFELELNAVIQAIGESPLMYPRIYREVRRALMRHLPYAVYFVVDGERISVFHVLHHARDPRRWQSR